ncbi:MAG: biotin synthase BioB [Negativicutes bacterium]|nr:biotin synthase BioB [Negativicutes bacterium]
MRTNEIVDLGERVLAGHLLTYNEAITLASIDDTDIPLLAAYAHKIRAAFAGNGVEMCGIINARSGRCAEDCKFCAQSAYYVTEAPVYPLLDSKEIVEQAKKIKALGATRVSVVTSGKGMERDADFPRILAAIRDVIDATGLAVCANLGTISREQAIELARSGVKRYAHNLETSAQFYPSICSTHSFEDRLETLKAVKDAGLELCSGGIIGLGETWRDRVELAFKLREFNVQSVPVNILNPLKGTALENRFPPKPLETLKTFALFRFILPSTVLRPAGGRELNLRDMQGALMLAGANGLIVGNYLTFTGRDAAQDFVMIKDAGFFPAH